MTEQIPARKDQLFGTYGPGGANALLPEAQPADPGMLDHGSRGVLGLGFVIEDLGFRV
jgi:hypothetical protein